MAKVKVKGSPITPRGSFTNGQILTSDRYPIEFLTHLVNEANAAEWVERETKMEPKFENKIDPVHENKSAPPEPATPEKEHEVTKKKRKKRRL